MLRTVYKFVSILDQSLAHLAKDKYLESTAWYQAYVTGSFIGPKVTRFEVVDPDFGHLKHSHIYEDFPDADVLWEPKKLGNDVISKDDFRTKLVNEDSEGMLRKLDNKNVIHHEGQETAGMITYIASYLLQLSITHNDNLGFRCTFRR